MSLFVFFSCRVYVRVSIDYFSSLHPFLFSSVSIFSLRANGGLLPCLLTSFSLLAVGSVYWAAWRASKQGMGFGEWMDGWMGWNGMEWDRVDGWVKNRTGLDWTLGGIWDMGFLVGLFLFFQHCRFLRVGLACSLVCLYILGVQETRHWLADWVGQSFLSIHVLVVIVVVGGCLSN